jgi:hypothetical protein
MEIERAGLVEKDLTAAGDDLFDQFVHRVVQGSGAAAGVGEQPIAVGGEVCRILEVGLDDRVYAPFFPGISVISANTLNK